MFKQMMRVQPGLFLRRQFSTANPTVGFIGLGNMGGHMANNLMKAGYKLVVYDISKDATDKAASHGATVAGTVKEIAQQSDIIVTMLPSSPHVRSVYGDEDGLINNVKPNTLFIDSSTIDPASSKFVSNLANEKNCEMVDAPVSGGVGGAEAGTLTFMVGGEKAAFDNAKTVLDKMGKNIVHCGAAGTGQVAKISNNLILGICMGAVSEGMALGAKLGMDPKLLASIINTSSGRCWSSDTYNPCPGVIESVPASKGYEGGFGVDLLKKDLGLAVTAAEDAGVKLPLVDKTISLYDQISKDGSGRKDFSIMYDYISKNKL